MRTAVPEKVLAIADEIDERGSAEVTRLTVLKKWFQRPERLTAVALWVAARATSRKGKTGGQAGRLFAEARKLLKGLDRVRPKPNRQAAAELHDRLREFQNEYERQALGTSSHHQELEPIHRGRGLGDLSGLRQLTSGRLQIGSRLLQALRFPLWGKLERPKQHEIGRAGAVHVHD